MPAAARGSGTPLGTMMQRPGEFGREHEEHRPSQAESQHMPSTQKPEAHSGPVVQTWPTPLGPQLPFTQVAGVRHWSSTWQVPRQSPPAAHMNGAQLIEAPATHEPASSHTLAGLKVAPVHVAGRHTPPTG